MSEEVKLFRATYRGYSRLLRLVGTVEHKGARIFANVSDQYPSMDFQYRESDLSDLTELTFHPKGEKVCLDVHPYVMRRFLRYAELKESERSPIIAYKFEGLRIDLLAQLTPSAEGGADEFKDWNDIARDYEASHSPVKVGIELTEEQLTSFKQLISDMRGDIRIWRNRPDVANNSTVIEELEHYAAAFESLLTPAPMTEQEEPKERGALIKAKCVHSDMNTVFGHGEDTYTRFKESNDKPWIAENGTRHNWSDLINPTRVGGAE